MNFEQEFEQYKNIHKYCVLKARLVEIFEKEGVNIPNFLDKELESRIDYCMCEIAKAGKYDELYELAWNETKERFS